MMKKPKNIDEYLEGFPKETQKILEQVRVTIKKAAPLAEELISYGMPAFKLNGGLVWFAAWSKHISIYPRVSVPGALKKELSNYGGTKASVHFPLNKPMPLSLITKVVKHRMKENQGRVKEKKK